MLVVAVVVEVMVVFIIVVLVVAVVVVVIVVIKVVVVSNEVHSRRFFLGVLGVVSERSSLSRLVLTNNLSMDILCDRLASL